MKSEHTIYRELKLPSDEFINEINALVGWAREPRGACRVAALEYQLYLLR